jgi:predicted ArsR family transcriptional regulator
MDAAQFERSIEDLTGALGDPTRRGIYITVRESPEPFTSSAIAKAFDIHPNVARHHLDRLAHDGYLEVTTRRAGGRSGPGAGRPAKHYTATAKQIELNYPTRRLDVLTDMLLRVIARMERDDAAKLAYEVGYEYGKELADEVGLPTDEGFADAVRSVARAMTGIGFGMKADTDANQLLTTHCPFGAVATDHPEIVCSLDQGLISGLLGSIDRTWEPVLIPHVNSDEACITELSI